MTEFEIIKKLCEIDMQLIKNKEHIDAYAGQEVPADSSIIRLCEVTKLLMIEKLRMQKLLLDTYGIHYF